MVFMLRIDELASCNKFTKKKQDLNALDKICFGHLKFWKTLPNQETPLTTF